MRTSALDGSICLLGLIFTHCETVCPLLTQTLCRLGRRCDEARAAGGTAAGGRTPGGWRGSPWLRIVSVTVDPWRDDPQRLAAYAREQGAEGTLFLTGEPDALLRFMKSVFLVSERVTSLEPETHSAGIVLLDPYRRVRGLYFRRTPAELDRIVVEVARLARELGW
jgi:cytochrome oxidase Cu insertion factor (SCO1/SenC/PrrC family)